MLAYINTWTIALVGPHNFGAKWFGGRARPEEVAWLIHENMIGAPEEIVRKIKEIKNFNQATDFTRYHRDGSSGSPRHPSWPAMHSAGSNMSFWIQVVMNLTPRQLCEAKKVDFAVSFARTVAGVHFEDDNMAGLNMGQEIVARALPEFFAENYYSDIDTVTELVNNSRFKWEDYEPLQDCGYFMKYNKKWPHCTNLKCMTNSRDEFEAACDRYSECTGFSFTTGATSGYGCLKKCGNQEFGGYGRKTYDYWTK